MGNIKIIKGVFEEKLELQDASIVVGFPSPADDPEVESVKNDEKRHGDIVSALL